MKPWWIHPGTLLYKRFYETVTLKKKTQKKLHSQNYAAGMHGDNHKSDDFFYYPKKSLRKSRYPNNAWQTFLPKKILESKISNPKKSFGHPVTWTPEYFPPPPILPGIAWQTISASYMRSFLSRLPHTKSLYMPKMTKFPNFTQTSFISTKLIEHRYLLVDIVLKEFPLNCLSNQEA